MLGLSIADWIGILGFVLSLALAILEIKRRWKFLKVFNVKIVPMNNWNPEAYIYMVCTIENPASVQRPLTNISIKIPGIHRMSAIREEIVLFERINKRHGTHAEYSTTPLPVNLAPCSALDIVVAYRLSANDIPQPLRHPGGHNRPQQESVWIRIDLAGGSFSLPRYCRAVVADFETEGKNILSHAKMHS